MGRDSTSYHVYRYEEAKDKEDRNFGGGWKMMKSGSHYFPPRWEFYESGQEKLTNFYSVVGDIEEKVREHFRKKKKNLIAMVFNKGNIDLFLNFVCSIRRLGDVSILEKLVVFAADEETYNVTTNLGIFAYYNPSLGSFSTSHAKYYGDKIFVEIMWLKVLSVYAINKMEFSVLYQDADVVWMEVMMSSFASLCFALLH